jgi:hypothetical protein
MLKLPTGMSAVNQILNGDYISKNLIHQSYMQHLVNLEETRQADYIKYREYYDGDHETMLTARQKAFLQVKGDDEDFSLNLCRVIVNAPVERLEVTGIDAGDSGQGETLWQWARDNRLDGLQGIVHTAAIRDGDAFVLVEWNNEEQRPEWSFELACAGNEGVKVHYSKEKRGKIEFASKRWIVEFGGSDQKMRRINLYFADHIEKYQSGDSVNEGNWQPYLDEGAEELPGVFGMCGWHDWITKDGKPIGVPVIHFKNRDQGYDYGQSELKSIIPIQNALNKSEIDLIATSDLSAFRILVGTGKGWNGINLYPGMLVGIEDPEAALTALPGENPVPLIAVKNSFIEDAAAVSQTPLSRLRTTGQHPSAEAQQAEEAGLIAKVKKCQQDFGNSWEHVFKVSRALYNAYSGKQIDAAQRIEAQWKEPQTRNEQAHLATLEAKKRLGVPDEQIWREMGYNDEQIRQFKKTKMLEAAMAVRQQAKQLPAGQGVNNGNTTTGQRSAEPAEQPAAVAA